MPCHMTEIKQIGFVTPDIQATIKAFEAIGLTDWSPVTEVSPDGFTNMKLNGKPQEYAFLCATNNECEVELELIQPLDEESDYAQFIKKNDGHVALHHLSVMTDDEDALRNSGHKQLIVGHQKGIPFGWEYYDFREDLGTVLEYFPMDQSEE